MKYISKAHWAVRKSVFSLFLLFSFQAFSQVDQIKKESDKDKQKQDSITSTTTSSGNTNSDSSGRSGSGFLSGCFQGCINTIVSAAFEAMAEDQSDLLENKNDIPSLVSFSIMPNVALSNHNYFIDLPEARGNWGRYSSDFRYNAITETVKGGSDIYATNDWQILILNIFARQNFFICLGGGFMNETYSKRYFPELFLGTDITPSDKWLFSLETRQSRNFKTGSAPRSEVNLKAERKLFSSAHVCGYFSAGGLYQNYYSAVDLWTIQAGVHVMFH